MSLLHFRKKRLWSKNYPLRTFGLIRKKNKKCSYERGNYKELNKFNNCKGKPVSDDIGDCVSIL